MSLLAARIADENVEAAKLLHRVADELGTKGLIAKIARDSDAVAPCILDELDHFLRIRFFVRKVIDGDVGSFARVRDGCCAAHAAVAPRDQRLSSRQPAAAFVACLAVIRSRLHLGRQPRPGLRLALERRLGIFAGWILHLLNRLKSGGMGLRISGCLDHGGKTDPEASDHLAT